MIRILAPLLPYVVIAMFLNKWLKKWNWHNSADRELMCWLWPASIPLYLLYLVINSLWDVFKMFVRWFRRLHHQRERRRDIKRAKRGQHKGGPYRHVPRCEACGRALDPEES